MNTGAMTADTPPPAWSRTRGPGGIYYGWYNVGLSVICLTLALGSTAYSFGLFVKPVAADLGLSRATVNLGLILFHLGSLIFNPVLGILYDRLPLKLLMRISAASFAAGMVGVGLAQQAWLIGLLILVPISLGTVGCSALPGMVLAARWFKDKRARAISLVAMGTSLGGMLIFPVIAFLLNSYGWRQSLIIAGLGVGLTVLLVSLFIRAHPAAAEPGTEAQTAEVRAPVFPPRVILKTRAFWTIAPSVALMMGIDQTLLATITPYILDQGMGLAAAASIMSSITAAAIGGKFLLAWIGDRTDLRLMLAGTALCAFLLCATLLTQPGYWTILIVCLFTGTAIGVTYPIANALMARQFGASSIGTALGMKSPLISIAASIALYFIGAVHDRTGDYGLAFMVFCGVLVLATAIIPFIPKDSFAEGQSGNATGTSEA